MKPANGISILWLFLIFSGMCSVARCEALPFKAQQSDPKKVELGQIMKNNDNYKDLEISSEDGFGQLEIGGPFAGLEFHKNAILPNRISLFYPLANSIDNTHDYWERYKSKIWSLSFRLGNGDWKAFSEVKRKYRHSPTSLTFLCVTENLETTLSYRFGKTGFFFHLSCRNLSDKTVELSILSVLDIFLRTCSTYDWRHKAWTQFSPAHQTLWVNFDDIATEPVRVFVANAGEAPFAFSSKRQSGVIASIAENLNGDLIPRESRDMAAGAFLYKKNLSPGESLTVVQAIGSTNLGEGIEKVAFKPDRVANEIEIWEKEVMGKAFERGNFFTGLADLDHSALWSKAILAVNRHFLDGEQVPMPCPAEYNFFFTHDALMTDLGAVFFDPGRVRQDLDYLLRHSVVEEKLIPHAYLWKDGKFVTEAPGSDNWNHLWFVLVTARYLKHSGDREMASKLLPYLKKSLEMVLSNLKPDNVIWGTRPDWWDIGNRKGPRVYLTQLTIRALREFLYLGSVLDISREKLKKYEDLSHAMEKGFGEKFRVDGYLKSFFADGTKDDHFYMGSILAAHLGVLSRSQTEELLSTAQKVLLDPRLGIYCVFPMDFHKLQEFFHFRGNEAGDPYYYLNGGIWPHANAWYALGLMSVGKKNEALQFIESCMTVRGVMKGPNGQPAMPEYRIGKNDRAYGTIDKPQFLWAGGWYMYCLYHLFGVREDVWNITFDPWKAQGEKEVSFDLYHNGTLCKISVYGNSSQVQRVLWDGKEFPSLVIPETTPGTKAEICLGTPTVPLLKKAESRLISAKWEADSACLSLNLSSFIGHSDEIMVLSPTKPVSLKINGKLFPENLIIEEEAGIFSCHISRIQEKSQDRLEITFLP